MFDNRNKTNFIEKSLGTDIYSTHYDEGKTPVPPPLTDFWSIEPEGDIWLIQPEGDSWVIAGGL